MKRVSIVLICAVTLLGAAGGAVAGEKSHPGWDRLQRLRHGGHDLFPIVHADRVHRIGLEGSGVGGRRMSPHQDEGVWDGASDVAGGLEYTVVLESMHAGQADEPRPRAAQRGCETVEPQVRGGRGMPGSPQGRADVLEPQRLDPEEGTEPETFISGVGA